MRIRRVALGLTSVLVVLVMAACGAGGGGAPGPGPAPSGSGVLVTSRVTGGIAGVDDGLAVTREGRVTVTSRRGPEGHGQLTADQLATLVETLDAADFPTLPPDTVDPGVADAFVYEVTYQGVRVRTSDGAVPDHLVPVLDQLREVRSVVVDGGADRPLEGPQWQLESIVTGGAPGPLPGGTGATLEFGSGAVQIHVVDCNQGFGNVEITGSQIVVGTLTMTARACEPDPSTVEAAVTGVLNGAITYAIDGDRLTLTHPGGQGLVLRAAG